MGGKVSDLIVSLWVNELDELVWKFCVLSFEFSITELFRVSSSSGCVYVGNGLDEVAWEFLCVRICIFDM